MNTAIRHIGIRTRCNPRPSRVRTEQASYDLHSLEAHRDDLADEAEDVLRVVFAVCVVGDAAAFVGGNLVLVEDSFEGGAVAELVFLGFGRDIFERQELVVD